MLVTGRFGLKSYSLTTRRTRSCSTRSPPRTCGCRAIRPSTSDDADRGPISTFWQNEDMDVDQHASSCCSRAIRAPTRARPRASPASPTRTGRPTSPASTSWTRRTRSALRSCPSSSCRPGHTTTCINDCQWLWTGGPAARPAQSAAHGWTFGRPIIVTDLRIRASRSAYPMDPVDLFRRDGVTAYSHDVQVDDRGHRVGVRRRRHARLLDAAAATTTRSTGAVRAATPLDPIPYGGGGLPASVTGDDDTAASSTTPGGPSAATRRRATRATARASCCSATEEDFGPAEEACRSAGQFTIASLRAATTARPGARRPGNRSGCRPSGSWSPYQKEGSRPIGGPYDPLANFCSAHYFDVDGSTVTYAWYGEGTRFLDISDPANPTPVRLLAARRRHRLGLVPARRLRLHRGPHARRGRPAG